MKEIQRYLQKNFGLSIRLSSLTELELRKLPLYLKSGYELEKTHLGEAKLIFAKPKEQYSPGQLEKQREMLKDILQGIVIFVLDDVESYLRKRLIRNQIAFVQINKQLYIPELWVDLNDIRSLIKNEEPKNTNLSYQAQFTILYHLEVGTIEDISLMDIATLFGKSAMTISRIVKELDQHQIISVQGTKEKKICFKTKNKSQIWELVKNLMVSPVKKVYYTDYPLDEEQKAILCYDNALAKYSMLSEGRQAAFALSRADFSILEEKRGLQINEYGKFRVEIWAYDLSALSRKRVVDPLSLYLSMRDQGDERVKMALEQMIENIKW